MAQKNPPSQAALVLIVDDDKAVAEISAEILGTLGYDVLTARNGPEAVALLRRNSCVSVLFTDIQVPDIGRRGACGDCVDAATENSSGLHIGIPHTASERCFHPETI